MPSIIWRAVRAAFAAAMALQPFSDAQLASVSNLAGSQGQTGYADGMSFFSTFNSPMGIAADGAWTFALVADSGNFVVRRVALASGSVVTLAGSPTSSGTADGTGTVARFSFPSAIAMDAAGTTALVADTFGHTLRRVAVATGVVSTLAGTPATAGHANGLGAAATFYLPGGVAMTSAGDVALVADTGNHLIRRVVVATAAVTTLAGVYGSSLYYADGPAASALFRSPRGIAMDSAGRVALIVEQGNHLVRRINTTSAVVSTVAGSPGVSGAADGASALFCNPTAIYMNGSASFALIADANNSCIRSVNLVTSTVSTVTAAPPPFLPLSIPGNLYYPMAVVMNSAGTLALATDASANYIASFAVPPPASDTPTMTFTASTTGTSTQSSSPSESVTATTTGSSSQRATMSQSSSRTPTQTSSPTLSSSPSMTLSRNPTQTQSPTQSFSTSMSPSASAAGTPSQTRTGSGSLTASLSQSSTQTSSETVTTSVSPTTSASQRSSPSMTTSASATFSPSVSQQQSAAASLSGTPSLSGSVSPTASATRTPSNSHTISQAATVSSTRTASESCSATLTGTMSSTQSSSVSSTAVALPSSTLSSSSSSRPSPSSSISPSASQAYASGTATPSPSSTIPASATPSMSTRPYSLYITDARSGQAWGRISSASSPSLPLSDATPPTILSFALDRCPSASGMYLNCLTAQRLSGDSNYNLILPYVSTSHIEVSCDARDARLSATATVGLTFHSPGGVASLACQVESTVTGASLAYAEVPLIASPAMWPVWIDAVLVSPNGLSRSAVLGTLATVSTSESVLQPASLLSSVKGQWEHVNVSRAPSTQGPFGVTVYGHSLVVLRAESAVAFGNDTTATVGDATVDVLAVSTDGLWILLQMPAAVDVCSSGNSADCGYATLSLSNAPRDAPRCALTCPPFCPGRLDPPYIVPIVTNDSGVATTVLAAAPLIPTSGPPVRLAAPPLTSTGFYFALNCSQSGVFTDPLSGACANASDPAASQCAYGSGTGCVACPAAALCPGGSRVWPRPGSWAASELGGPGGVLSCPLPAPRERCLGWNASAGASQCGAPYLQGSFLCSACAPGHFLDDTGACAACPKIDNPWQRYGGLVYVFAGIAGVVLLVYCGLALLVHFVGGTITGGLYRMSNLALWALACAQVVSDAAAVVSPSLPPLIAGLYRSLAVLQLQGVLLPPACTGAHPFETDVSVLASALALWLAAVLCYYACRDHASRLLGQFALTGAMLLYPASVLAAVPLLRCQTVTLSALGAAALDGGPAPPASVTAASVVSVQVLIHAPFQVCWSANHVGPAVLAALTLAFFVLAMPALTYWWVYNDPSVRMASRSSSAAAAAASAVIAALPAGASGEGVLRAAQRASVLALSVLPYDPFLGAFFCDYKPTAWHTKHLDLGLLLLLSLFRALLPRPTDLEGIVAKTVVITLTLLAFCGHVLWIRPYAKENSWMGWVRVLLLLDSIGCTALNASVLALEGGLGGDTLAGSITAGAYIVYVMCICTLVALLGGFSWRMYRDAKREQEEIDKKRKASLPPPAPTDTLPSPSPPRPVRPSTVVVISCDDEEAATFSNPLRASDGGTGNPRTAGIVAGSAPSLVVRTAAQQQHHQQLRSDAANSLSFAAAQVMPGRGAVSSRRIRSELHGVPRSLRAAARTLANPASSGEDVAAACEIIATVPSADARAACPAMLPLLEHRMGPELAVLQQSTGPGSEAPRLAAEAVFSGLCRAAVALTDHCEDDAPLAAFAAGGVPDSILGVLAQSSAAGGAALDNRTIARSCWLLGNAAMEPGAAARILEAQGVATLTRLLSRAVSLAPPRASLLTDAGSLAWLEEAAQGGECLTPEAVALSDVALQSLVALASLAQHGGAAARALASPALVTAIVAAISAYGNVHVAEAGCRILGTALTRQAGDSADVARAALAALQACDGLLLVALILASPHAVTDADAAVAAAEVLACGLALEQGERSARSGEGGEEEEGAVAAAVREAGVGEALQRLTSQ